MANPQYGAKAPHRLIDSDTDAEPILIQLAINGTPSDDLLIYASPKITDISIKNRGNIDESANVQGGASSVSVSQEGIDITYTIVPHGSTKAYALAGTHIFRKASPVKVSRAPIILGIGHETAAGMWADLLNSDAPDEHATSYVTDHDIKLSTTGMTTGTISVFRKPGLVAATPIA